MRMRHVSAVMAAAAAVSLLALSWAPASAQEKAKEGKKVPYPGAVRPTKAPPPGPPGPVPLLPDGKPDFSGLWNSQRELPGDAEPEMLPWAAALTKQRVENYSADDPEARCVPGGVPRATPYHVQMVSTPTLVVILFEGNIHSFRQIFLDRKEHLKITEPLWYGDSIGHWEGDTLVVDTIGLNDKFWFGMSGQPHTTQLHVIERYHRRDFGNLEVEVTILDPGTFTKPWVQHRLATIETDWDMIEYVCNENNQDPTRLVGDKDKH
jgi:hypothetical protein